MTLEVQNLAPTSRVLSSFYGIKPELFHCLSQLFLQKNLHTSEKHVPCPRSLNYNRNSYLQISNLKRSKCYWEKLLFSCQFITFVFQKLIPDTETDFIKSLVLLPFCAGDFFCFCGRRLWTFM